VSDPNQWSVNLTEPKYTVTVTGDEYKVVLAPGVPIGGISDAPADGKVYGRKDRAWVEIRGTHLYRTFTALRAETVYAVDQIAVVAEPPMPTMLYAATVSGEADSGNGGQYIRPDNYTTILWAQIM